MPTSPANPTRVMVPMMALAMPPPGSPGGLGNWVKKCRSRELAPALSRLKSTKASGAITTSAQIKHRPDMPERTCVPCVLHAANAAFSVADCESRRVRSTNAWRNLFPLPLVEDCRRWFALCRRLHSDALFAGVDVRHVGWRLPVVLRQAGPVEQVEQLVQHQPDGGAVFVPRVAAVGHHRMDQVGQQRRQRPRIGGVLGLQGQLDQALEITGLLVVLPGMAEHHAQAVDCRFAGHRQVFAAPSIVGAVDHSLHGGENPFVDVSHWPRSSWKPQYSLGACRNSSEPVTPSARRFTTVHGAQKASTSKSRRSSSLSHTDRKSTRLNSSHLGISY